MEGELQAEQIFPVKSEYGRCVTSLKQVGILTVIPELKSTGVKGIDVKEYPVPTLEQVAALFDLNRELVSRKVQQGFDRLQLTPMAMSVRHLFGLLKTAVIRHAATGKIYQTRRSPADPLIPVRVNSDKHVWVWDTLWQSADTDEIVYFPREYSDNHRGMTKSETIIYGSICAVPGWSVGLVESKAFIPRQGQGKTLAGRKQLETGFSPREYLQTLQAGPYEGETGKTLEDFITGFLIRLEEADEVSNDRYDDNALWCLGQYVKIRYAELVPTGWWHREYGRVRLDMHRTGNKQCTKSWGVSTTVRLPLL